MLSSLFSLITLKMLSLYAKASLMAKKISNKEDSTNSSL
ncbi:hypothetical protein Goshw_014136 [Gossypium schwendimanii]|uniref:Uncharacterized protein n=1 Tax=Gossypium schwendimanii TaxID=34291 RepID=A0A7J9N0E2_GOSSC|nr:hypothetical protein [Gossypium schwendimanii]